MTETVFKIPPGKPDWFHDHLRSYLSTDGQAGHYVDFTPWGGQERTPTLLLTTTGRASGEAHTLPLIYGDSGGKYVIIASKGGAPHHPAWYLNLVAHPEVGLQVGDKRMQARARTATGAERQALWGMMAKIYPPYDEYQQRAGREIPVVVLEPIG